MAALNSDPIFVYAVKELRRLRYKEPVVAATTYKVPEFIVSCINRLSCRYELSSQRKLLRCRFVFPRDWRLW
jgi:hypothetical protein